MYKLKGESAIASFAEKRLQYIFVIPALSILALLLGYPIISSVYYALTDKSLIRPTATFVGLQNFIEIFQDSVFKVSMLNSIFFTLAIVSLQLAVGMIAALALNAIPKFKGFFRTLLIIPWTFPNIVMAFTWNWLFNDLYGPINATLLKLGIIDSPILFLSKPNLAIMSVILVMVWFGFPFMMVSILAGLQSISRSEYEAAQMDGANALQSFRHITLPHLKNILGLITVLRIIWVFNNFDLIFLLTGGGPGDATQTIPLYAYRTGWGLNNLGKASAIAITLLVFLVLCSNLYFKALEKKSKENNEL
ncbi:MAG: sugar ABC transporter permease [Ruthenibacterium sp.]